MDNEKHTCEALVLFCIDFRFHEGFLEKIKNELGTESFDIVALAGGAKNIVSPESQAFVDVVFRNLEISAKLHEIKKVILTNHIDCGAYGGSQSFNSPEEEINFHKSELSRARAIVQKQFPKLDIEVYLVYKEGSEVKLLRV